MQGKSIVQRIFRSLTSCQAQRTVAGKLLYEFLEVRKHQFCMPMVKEMPKNHHHFFKPSSLFALADARVQT